MIVEDGTGIENANSYVSVNDALDILETFGMVDSGSTLKDSSLVRASYFLDSKLIPKGRLLNKEQGLLWPRTPFKDNQNRDVEGIPVSVKRVVSFIANEIEQGNDIFDKSPGLRSQTFGDASETYSGVYSEDAKINTWIKDLMVLGYGSSGASTVTITRA